MIRGLVPVLEWIVLFLPILLVVYQALLLSRVTGGRRHYRGLGISAYLSGLSMLVVGFIDLMLGSGGTGPERAIVFVIIFLVGLCLPLAGYLVREDNHGSLILSVGERYSRMIGMFVYLFCVYVIQDMRGL